MPEKKSNTRLNAQQNIQASHRSPTHSAVLDWLLDGDHVIRWQVMRDLLEEPEFIWRAEQNRLPSDGWVAAILQRQFPNGAWPKGRWTDTIWTLLVLLDCGIPTHLPTLQGDDTSHFSLLLALYGVARSRLHALNCAFQRSAS